MRLCTLGRLVAAATLFGCAHAPPPAAPEKPRLKVVVLPVEEDPYPDVAASLNSALSTVRVKGIDDYALSKVTLEVAQLSIECVQPTSECYSAVGKSLAANELFFAHIDTIGKRRHAQLRVTLTRFDVDGGKAKNVIERVFKSAELATQAAKELVGQLTSEPTS
jgi:hypothetical protein